MSSVDHAALHAAAHAYAFELLPWYQNGSLTGEECERVRRHLGECLVCRRDLLRLSRLTAALAAPASEQASAQAYARLAARLAVDDAPAAWWRPRRLLEALRRLGTPIPLSIGAVAGAVLAVALIALTGGVGEASLPVSGAQRFQTLGVQPASGTQLSHPLVRIVLDDALDPSGRAAWLARHGAELVDGPSAIGVLTVRINLRRHSMTRMLDELRADPQTLFVEAIDVVGTRPDRRR